MIYQNKSSAVSQIIEEYISQSLKEDEILLFYGIGPHVQKLLWGFDKKFKNQCESVLMYYNENLKMQKRSKIIRFLNKNIQNFFLIVSYSILKALLRS